MYNLHNGETGVIIGNGPSLKDVPTSFLEKYPTFGANRIYLRFQPTYFVSVNDLVLQQFTEDIANLKCKKFVKAAFAEACGATPLNSVGMQTFSFNPLSYIYEGFTVTYVSMQLAFFMGFSTVLLVGVDHKFTYVGKPNEERVMEGDDPNHFDPNYFKGVRWNNPDLDQSNESYKMARTAYEENDRSIINLTPESGTDVFEKGNLEDYV